MPAPDYLIFTGQMLFLTPNQQCQSTEGNRMLTTYIVNSSFKTQGCITQQIVAIYPQPLAGHKPKPTDACKHFSYACALCTTVIHDTVHNSSDNLPSSLQHCEN